MTSHTILFGILLHCIVSQTYSQSNGKRDGCWLKNGVQGYCTRYSQCPTNCYSHEVQPDLQCSPEQPDNRNLRVCCQRNCRREVVHQRLELTTRSSSLSDTDNRFDHVETIYDVKNIYQDPQYDLGKQEPSTRRPHRSKTSSAASTHLYNINSPSKNRDTYQSQDTLNNHKTQSSYPTNNQKPYRETPTYVETSQPEPSTFNKPVYQSQSYDSTRRPNPQQINRRPVSQQSTEDGEKRREEESQHNKPVYQSQTYDQTRRPNPQQINRPEPSNFNNPVYQPQSYNQTRRPNPQQINRRPVSQQSTEDSEKRREEESEHNKPVYQSQTYDQTRRPNPQQINRPEPSNFNNPVYQPQSYNQTRRPNPQQINRRPVSQQSTEDSEKHREEESQYYKPVYQSQTYDQTRRPNPQQTNRRPVYKPQQSTEDSEQHGEENSQSNRPYQSNQQSTSDIYYRPSGNSGGKRPRPIPQQSTSNVATISEIKCKEYSELAKERVTGLPLTTDPKPVHISVDKCNLNAQQLIVGGHNTTIGEFPHMAAIGFVDKQKRTIAWNCGGSLISEHFVLTAAHCATSSYGPPSVVRLGEHNLRRADDGAHPVDYLVKEVVRHPSHKPPIHYHDIALLRLSRQVVFTKFIRPACLYNKPSLTETKAIATGWGRVHYAEDQSDVLLKVVLNIIDNPKCNELYTNSHTDRLSRGIIDEQMCAGELEGRKDTCQGDSGGPIEVTSQGNNCVHHVIGITSFGKSCGQPNAPGVYTRVSSYVPWIENIVWPESLHRRPTSTGSNE